MYSYILTAHNLSQRHEYGVLAREGLLIELAGIGVGSARPRASTRTTRTRHLVCSRTLHRCFPLQRILDLYRKRDPGTIPITTPLQRATVPFAGIPPQSIRSL